MDRYQNLIGGQWCDGSSGQEVPNIDPADTRRQLGSVVFADASDVDRAVEAAAKAFKSWRQVPAPQRGRMMFKVLELFEAEADAFARALTAEEGKIFAESQGECRKTAILIEYLAGEGRRFGGRTAPSELSSTFAYTAREPLGVVGLITPWNFPIAIPFWKLVPALVAGNTAVLKPSELTPDTACRIARIFEQAGVPAGVVNLVHGGREVGERLVGHPQVPAISFTGSTEVGSRVYAAAALQLKRVQCEMGGKNPILLLDDADLELAVDATVKGAFGATGQRCTATSRAIVVESLADAFVESLAERARAFRPGPGMDPASQSGPLVSGGQLERVLQMIEVGKGEAQLVAGGKRFNDAEREHGFFIEPAVFDRVSPNARIGQEEVFGPVLCVQRVRDLDEALQVANGVRFGLSSSVYTRDLALAQRFIDGIETGIVHVNSPTMGGEAQLPFGGCKATGVGPREMGPQALEFFSREKAVYVDYTGARRSSNIY